MVTITDMGTQDVEERGRSYGGLSPNERRAQRRRRLLDAALELFGTVGYGGTSIEQICTVSKVTTRHFYEEYQSREQLLKAIFAEVVFHVSNNVLEALAKCSDDFVEKIRAGVGAFVRTLLEDPRMGRIYCVEVVGVSQEMELHRRSFQHLFAQVVQQQADSIRRSPQIQYLEGLNFTYATLALVGGSNELITEKLIGDCPLTVEDIIDEISWLYITVGSILLGFDRSVIDDPKYLPRSRQI